MKRNETMLLPILVLLASAQPTPALAYVGPGAGLSAIGSLVALVGAVVLAIVGFARYPVKRLTGSRRKAPAGAGGAGSGQGTGGGAR